MNSRQIAFIICANDALYYNECIRYIEELYIPEGYSIDTICIQEADSMVQGYNAGMQASDAKYKVYLHQDTFILNRNFIYDVIEIFQKDETIGMIGVLGGNQVFADTNYHLWWDTGCSAVSHGWAAMEDAVFQSPDKPLIEVNAVDGLMMVTQYDVPWREDFLDGWEFYDVSQSLEMRKKGYKVVVPYQKTPWCFHDCGVRKLIEYDKYKERMFQECPDIFGKKAKKEQSTDESQELLELEEIRSGLIILLEQREYETLAEAMENIRFIWPEDTQIREIADILEIYFLEESNATQHSELFQLHTWEEMYEYYKWIYFALMRMEYGREDERIETLKEKVKQGKISRDAIRKISCSGLKSTSEIFRCLLKEKKDEPLVSVIVAVYNGAETIAETLDSILNQTYQNMEVIVVDDASGDNSREIVSAYKDARIKKVFLEKNHNICYAGNEGFKKAKGKYVALIGHDDIWKVDKLEKQVSFLEEHQTYAACYTWADIIDENHTIINHKWKWLYRIFCGNNYSQDYWERRLFLRGNQFCAPSACIRRELLEKAGFYRYGLVQLQDHDLWMRLICEGPVYVLQEKLVLYRRFSKEERNLSAVSVASNNRGSHERQWMQDTFINRLSAEEFVRIFKSDMENPQAIGEKEILCEKVLLLRKIRNCYFVKRLIELIEDEECRVILEEKYHFTLADFYKVNTEPLLFDDMSLELT